MSANRIPRMPARPIPTRRGLLRRMALTVRRWVLTHRAEQIKHQIATLQHHMALDLSALFALDLDAHCGPVIRRRHTDDKAEIARLQRALAALEQAMTDLED